MTAFAKLVAQGRSDAVYGAFGAAPQFKRLHLLVLNAARCALECNVDWAKWLHQ